MTGIIGGEVIKRIKTIDEMKEFSATLRGEGRTLAFVPTMGFLHRGHLALMEEAKKRAGELIVSIFVNPAQFGPDEDLATYPRALEQDCDLCRERGAAAVFTPQAEEMYPESFQTYIELERLPLHLCGLSRPVFFKGIATVVAKLFNIVNPHVAVFGEKDYQQLIIIQRMVKDLCFAVDVVGVPIVREENGLAMSSRNKYLSAGQRPGALLLYQSLVQAGEMIAQGETNAAAVSQMAWAKLASCADITVDYISICDPVTLDEVECIDGPVLMAMAIMLGKTRLIDNMMMTPAARSSEIKAAG